VAKSDGEGGELAGDGGFVDVGADADAEAGEEFRRGPGRGGDEALVLLGHGALDQFEGRVGDRAGVLDDGLGLGQLQRDAVVVGLEQGEGLARLGLLDPAEDAGDLLRRDGAVDDAQLEELLGEELGLFGGGNRRRESEGERGSGLSVGTQTVVSSFVAVSL